MYSSPIVQPTGNVQTLLELLPNIDSAPLVKRASRPRIPTTADQIQRALEHAQTAGFDAGFEEGRRAGLIEGHMEGHDKGFTQAHNEATNVFNREIEQFVKELRNRLDSVQTATERWCADTEERVTDLAIEAVRNILNAELALSRESVLGIVREVLGNVTHATRARLRVNPFDAPIVSQHRDKLLAASATLRDIDIVEDPRITGGCIVETDGGILDATVDTRLELIQGGLGEAA